MQHGDEGRQDKRSTVPFLFLQAMGLAVCVVFPEIILWLPRLVYG